MKKLLLIMSLSSLAYAGGNEPVPPPLPPVGQPVNQSSVHQDVKGPAEVKTTTTTTISPSPAADNSVCVGSKIVCECRNPEPKVKTITKTIKVPQQCPEQKACPAQKPQKEKVREIIKEVPTPYPVEKLVSDPNDYTRHSFTLMLGKGPQGVDLQLYGGQYEAWQRYGFTAGAMYEYNLTKNWAVGGGGFMNETYFGAITFRK